MIITHTAKKSGAFGKTSVSGSLERLGALIEIGKLYVLDPKFENAHSTAWVKEYIEKKVILLVVDIVNGYAVCHRPGGLQPFFIAGSHLKDAAD